MVIRTDDCLPGRTYPSMPTDNLRYLFETHMAFLLLHIPREVGPLKIAVRKNLTT